MRRAIRFLMVAAAALASVVVYTRLPERVAVHWNYRLEPDRYGSPLEAVLVMPLVMLFVWGLLRFLPKIDPHRANYEKFRGTYDTMIDALLALFFVIHVAILLGAAGAPGSMEVLIRLAIGALFIILGNIMPRTRQNWFVGVRTPWTLANARVWEKTHRVAGYLFVGLGVVTILTIPLGSHVGVPAMAAGVAIAALGSFIYSYFAWRKEQA
jgi:uncharacterized membrane protein